MAIFNVELEYIQLDPLDIIAVCPLKRGPRLSAFGARLSIRKVILEEENKTLSPKRLIGLGYLDYDLVFDKRRDTHLSIADRDDGSGVEGRGDDKSTFSFSQVFKAVLRISGL